MKENLPGLHWAGRLDCKSGVVRTEAFYRGEKVSDILRVLKKEANGNLHRATEILNDDLESDGVGVISPEEVSRVARFASRHPIKTVRRLAALKRRSH